MSNESQQPLLFRQAVVAGLSYRYAELGLKLPEYPAAVTGEGVSVDRGRLAVLARVEAFHRDRMEQVLTVGSEVGITKPARNAPADESMAAFYRVMGRRDALASFNEELRSLHDFAHDMVHSRFVDPKVLDRLEQRLTGATSESPSTAKGLRSGLLPTELELSCTRALSQGWLETHQEVRDLADQGRVALISADDNSKAAWGGHTRLLLATHADFLINIDDGSSRSTSEKSQAAQQWWIAAQSRRILQATIVNLATSHRPHFEAALRAAPDGARQKQPTKYWAVVEQIMLAREDLQVPPDDLRPLGRPLFRRPSAGTTYVNPRTGIDLSGDELIEVSSDRSSSGDAVAKALAQAHHEVLIAGRLSELSESLQVGPSRDSGHERVGASLEQ